VTADDHPGGPVAFESAHRPEAGLQSSVVGFDPIVRVRLGVVKRARHEFLDDRAQCRGSVGHDFDRLTVITERRLEKPTRCSGVASRRDEYVDDLAYWSTAR
jgi:hypothetical protein